MGRESARTRVQAWSDHRANHRAKPLFRQEIRAADRPAIRLWAVERGAGLQVIRALGYE